MPRGHTHASRQLLLSSNQRWLMARAHVGIPACTPFVRPLGTTPGHSSVATTPGSPEVPLHSLPSIPPGTSPCTPSPLSGSLDGGIFLQQQHLDLTAVSVTRPRAQSEQSASRLTGASPCTGQHSSSRACTPSIAVHRVAVQRRRQSGAAAGGSGGSLQSALAQAAIDNNALLPRLQASRL